MTRLLTRRWPHWDNQLSFRLSAGLTFAVLILLLSTGCHERTSASSTSLSPEQETERTMLVGRQVQEAAAMWLGEQSTVAQYDGFRWLGAANGLRGMTLLEQPGTGQLGSASVRPPWIIADNVIYLRDETGKHGLPGGEWLRVTPRSLLRAAEAGTGSTKEQVRAALDQIRFVLWADPLWVVESMDVTEVATGRQDDEGVIAGTISGTLPNPDAYWPELQAARRLVESGSDSWQTPLLVPGVPGISASLETDRQGRPVALRYLGPDGRIWEWEFEETSETVREPLGADEWPRPMG